MSVDAILGKDVNHVINSFCNSNTFIFNGTICKEWGHSDSRITSLNEVISSLSRLEEYFNNGGRYEYIMGFAMSQGYSAMTNLYDNYKLIKV